MTKAEKAFEKQVLDALKGSHKLDGLVAKVCAQLKYLHGCDGCDDRCWMEDREHSYKVVPK